MVPALCLEAGSLIPPPSIQSPFAWHEARVPYNDTSEDVTPPSSLVRAHARPSISAGLWFSLAPAVFAGCRQSLLTDGPSRYYPCTPCVGAWTHTPPSPVGALALFFPTDIGLASRKTRSANRNYPCPATSPGSSFSGLQSFATFRLLRSLGPRIAPTAPPYGSGQLGRLHHALPSQLPVSSCGIATCLI